MDAKIIRTLARALTLVLYVSVLSLQAQTSPGEILTDRCSGEVRIPLHYNDGPDAPGTVQLARGKANKGWTAPLTVTVEKADCCQGTIFNPSQCGKFRWYCRPKGESQWVAEQSRCTALDTVIRAKLGNDRLVNFECLGTTLPACPTSGTSSSVVNPGFPGGACEQHDICQLGSRCNLATHLCEKIQTSSGCGDIGKACCSPRTAQSSGCPAGGACDSGNVCQLCGGKGQLCCGGLATQSCLASGLTCKSGYCQ